MLFYSAYIYINKYSFKWEHFICVFECICKWSSIPVSMNTNWYFVSLVIRFGQTFTNLLIFNTSLSHFLVSANGAMHPGGENHFSLQIKFRFFLDMNCSTSVWLWCICVFCYLWCFKGQGSVSVGTSVRSVAHGIASCVTWSSQIIIIIIIIVRWWWWDFKDI